MRTRALVTVILSVSKTLCFLSFQDQGMSDFVRSKRRWAIVEKLQMNQWQKLANPKNACMSIQFSRTDHSQTPETLTESIATLFSKIISPKYSICVFWNLHFPGQRNSLCLARISNTPDCLDKLFNHSYKDKNIVQVHNYNLFYNQILEDIIYYSLKDCIISYLDYNNEL